MPPAVDPRLPPMAMEMMITSLEAASRPAMDRVANPVVVWADKVRNTACLSVSQLAPWDCIIDQAKTMPITSTTASKPRNSTSRKACRQP